jgi:hypothetical protein
MKHVKGIFLGVTILVVLANVLLVSLGHSGFAINMSKYTFIIILLFGTFYART